MLLINPPYGTREKKPIGQFNLSTIPLGLGYIAAVLELNEVHSTIIDMNILEMDLKELEDRIQKATPDIVGITSMTSNYSSAVKVVRAIKSWNPETVTVLGGVHATFMHEEILNSVPEVDVVVRFEGELTMSDLTEKIENGETLDRVKGISFREKDKVVTTPPRNRIENLDDLPYPAYHRYDPSVKEYIQRYNIRAVPILTTRGCPFECIFCSTAALHGRKYRTRSISKVVDQIEWLIDRYSVDSVSFVDDNFTMQQDRIFELCREIKQRNLSINWGCSTRTDMVTSELLKEMKKSGCDNIFFGIESASEEVLKIIKKGASANNSVKVVKQAEDTGIKTHCSFILGLPGETPETLDKIIDFIGEAEPTGRVLPNILEILPGTELYEKRDEYFTNYPSVTYADITKNQIEMLLKFFKIETHGERIFRITPPNIRIT